MIRSSGRKKRQKRVRAKIKGTFERVRLNIFRSNLHIYGSLVDDDKGKVIFSVNDKEVKDKKGTGTEKAYKVGLLLGEKAKFKKITKVVFDRAGYKYHGRVRALAQGAREGGLKF